MSKEPVKQAAHSVGFLDWSLWVECPNCGEDNNLADGDHDSEGDISKHIFTGNWGHLENYDIVCVNCKHEFNLERVEY